MITTVVRFKISLIFRMNLKGVNYGYSLSRPGFNE